MTPDTTTTTTTATPATPPPHPHPHPHPHRPRRGWGWAALLLVAVAGAGAAYYFLVPSKSNRASADEGGGRGPATRVEYTVPTPGGLQRTTTQTGTVHAFEAADLYAEVSGYLRTLKVDIGDHVKTGDLLAEIAAPELEKAVEIATAALKQSKAKVDIAEAGVQSAQAEVQSAKAKVTVSKANVETYASQRKYREKEKNRITSLANTGAVERKLVDEQLDRYESAVAAEHSANAEVESAQAEQATAEAKVASAKADLEAAKVNVEAAQADLEKAQVWAAFTKITSPYDGVITARNVHPGDLIRKASEGGTGKPLLSVARTDKMRVVIQVPDRDVPFTDVGDPAEVLIDALPGRTFNGKVARFAESEDPTDRTMRTEVDLPNPESTLREGMYGYTTLTLQTGSKDALTIPSSCLFDPRRGQASVYVVRDGKLAKVPVEYGADDGVHVEINKGLAAGDKVVVRYNGAIDDGIAVQAVAWQRPAAGEGEEH